MLLLYEEIIISVCCGYSSTAFVTALLSPTKSRAWLGIRLNGDVFFWVDQTLVDYSNWGPGEPNNDQQVRARRKMTPKTSR